MGRTNGKLIPFLKYNLEIERFMNLKFESAQVFYIELPRYEKDKCEAYETLLKAWYDCNGNELKYIGYSNAKSVFQAALKKSIYLISLPRIGKHLRFRFATDEEVTEKQILLREKMKSYMKPASPTYPPSVGSSGYHSGNEDSEVENMQTEMSVENFLDDVIKNPEKYIDGCSAILDDDFFNDDIENGESLALQNIQIDAFDLLNPTENSEHVKPVTELKITPVGLPGLVKKYWLCTKKINIESTLQLICELQIIENESSRIDEGSVVIPNEVWEPGITYDLKKSFELNEKYYIFFSPSTA